MTTVSPSSTATTFASLIVEAYDGGGGFDGFFFGEVLEGGGGVGSAAGGELGRDSTRSWYSGGTNP